MARNYHETQQDKILKIINGNKSHLTVKQISEISEIKVCSVLTAIRGLVKRRAVRLVSGSTYSDECWESRVYEATSMVDNIAPPLRYIPTGEFRGTDWIGSTSRPGSQDHLSVPSLRGGLHVQHRPPIGVQSIVVREPVGIQPNGRNKSKKWE